MMHWINDNKEWFFSGVGVVIISGIFKLIFDRKKDTEGKSITYTQHSGNNSTNVQGNNVNYYDNQKEEKKDAGN